MCHLLMTLRASKCSTALVLHEAVDAYRLVTISGSNGVETVATGTSLPVHCAYVWG